MKAESAGRVLTLETKLSGPYILKVPWLGIRIVKSGHQPAIGLLAGPGLRFHRLVAKFDEGGHLFPKWDQGVRGLRPTDDDSFLRRTLDEVLCDGLARVALFHHWTSDLLKNVQNAPRGRFTVPDWEGALEIPVDEIRLCHFGRHRASGPGQCSLELRPHLVLPFLEIFNRETPRLKAAGGFGIGDEAECIRDRSLRALLAEIIHRWDVRAEVGRALQNKGERQDFVFSLWNHTSGEPSQLRFARDNRR